MQVPGGRARSRGSGSLQSSPLPVKGPQRPITGLAKLRHLAVARTFTEDASLGAALVRMGFIQADPIRAPARAQDLTLRHRVAGYLAGDLERQYDRLEIEEDVFVNYGFLDRSLHALLHPRMTPARATREKRVRDLLAFVRERGDVHPRDAHAQFARGTVINYWGGSSNATTHLLDTMHYRGLLRVARRVAGIRVYAPRFPTPGPATAGERRARLDAVVDAILRKYAPLPAASLSWLVARLRYGAPQWRRDLPAALARATRRHTHARIDGVDWYWPSDERADRHDIPDRVRLLAPFDPLVWDRRRFELFWGWPYRFEAYTPAPKRKFGYYALPLLWRDRVIGWGNVTTGGDAEFGYVDRKVEKDPAYRRELENEVERMRRFLPG